MKIEFGFRSTDALSKWLDECEYYRRPVLFRNFYRKLLKLVPFPRATVHEKKMGNEA